MAEKIKILIADTHLLIREGIKSLLSKQNELTIVGEALESKELPEKIRLLQPDILIIDFQLPGYFSISDIAFVRKHYPKVNLLIISTNQNKKDILKVLDYGVNCYILKECDEGEIIQAIYASAKQEKFFCGKVVDAVLEQTTHKCVPGSPCDDCRPISLSNREIEIIKHISEGSTTKDIARKLYLSFHTVSTHRKNIFKKVNVRNSSELLLYAVKKGLIHTENTVVNSN